MRTLQSKLNKSWGTKQLSPSDELNKNKLNETQNKNELKEANQLKFSLVFSLSFF